jgi:hypothetical protein
MAPDEARYPGETPSDDLLAKFSRRAKDMEAHQSQWVDEAKECYDLVAGKQWPDDASIEMMANQKVPITFNRISPVIDAVRGAQITGRQEVAYVPRQVGNSAVNEILTNGAKYIRDRCDAEQEESDAASDMFICGLGCLETRMDYEIDPDGEVRKDRIDPLEMSWDPSARKPNLTDARYLRRRKPYSREEFEQMFPGYSPDGENDNGMKRPTIVDPATRYTHGTGDDQDDLDLVWVNEWQWYEREPFYRVQHPDTGQIAEVHPDHYEQVAGQAKAHGVELGGVRQVRRVYYRAFEACDQIMHVEKIAVGMFTYTFMTGKRDRNKGLWYGLVRPMKDPQLFANKFFSQMLHILNSNAKGGLMMEQDAAVDQRQFEESYAQADAITWMKAGAISGAKFAEKKAPQYPEGQDRLMQMCIQSIRDTTGVNQEILGQAERDQPGVLEAHRKQAAYGILSPFFDSIHLECKVGGRLLLRFIQLFVPASTLVRIEGNDGTAQYVPLALKDDTIKFDVIVDDAPSTPNQKQATWQMILSLLPILQQADLEPAMWAEIVRYSPFPDSFSQKLIQMLMQKQKSMGQPSPDDQLNQDLKMAKAKNDDASANHHNAQANFLTARAAQETMADPHGQADNKAALDHAQLELDKAKTGALLAKTVSDIVRDHRPEPTSTP